MKLCGIYLITHIASGRKYVGQSRDMKQRWKLHASGQGKTYLARAIRKEGWCAFKTDVLELCDPELLNDREVESIKTLGTLHPGGFNLTTGGKFFMHAPDVVARVAAMSRGRKRTPEEAARLRTMQCGAKHSEETRAKMSKAHRDNPRVLTDATRAKLSANAKKQVWSEESRAKIAAANARRIVTQEMRDKWPERLKGRKQPPEHVAKVKAALIGRKCSPEHVAKFTQGKKDARALRAKTAAFLIAVMTFPLVEKNARA